MKTQTLLNRLMLPAIALATWIAIPNCALADTLSEVAALARRPELWPQTVALKEPTIFPVILNGHSAGFVEVPAGAVVRLTGIRGEQLVVQYLSGARAIPAGSTDVLDRVRTRRAEKPAGAGTTTVIAADVKTESAADQETPEAPVGAYFGRASATVD